MQNKPVIAITMGDPGGVGPEIILKTVGTKAVIDVCRPLIIGDMKVLDEAMTPLAMSRRPMLKVVSDPYEDTGDAVGVIDLDNVNLAELTPGPRRDTIEFVMALQGDDGGFRGLWLDDAPDAEYTFYALLALGNLC